ncbi:MAG: alpha/beta fold hydrolase [Bacteroidota bacterium]
MKESTRSFTTPCGREMKYFEWLPDDQQTACVQIVHGMAEHAARYRHFAEYLTQKGFAVYASDHFGHGMTAGVIQNAGHFDDEQGWNKNTDALISFSKIIIKDKPTIPLFLLGHSMGSLFARDMISTEGALYKAVVISGTLFTPAMLLQAGHFISSVQKIFMGKRHLSHLLHKMTFGPNNKNIRNPLTPFDWLSHAPAICDAYQKDSFCGFVCTTQFYKDLFHGISNVQRKNNMKAIPDALPILIISGKEDPVGQFGKGVKMVHQLLMGAGKNISELQLLDGMRHEILNEVEREKVYSLVYSFFMSKSN